MPLDKYFNGKGRKVARAMKKTYGDKWEKVFYALANKNKKEKVSKKALDYLRS